MRLGASFEDGILVGIDIFDGCGDVLMELTPEDARRLHDVLGRILGIGELMPFPYQPTIICGENTCDGAGCGA